MIEGLHYKKEIKDFLANELKTNRVSGTYLFCGKDMEFMVDIALQLAKGLCCNVEINDFCDKCDTCYKINKRIYADLEIIDIPNGIKVDDVRELIYKSSIAPFEGNKKIFILKNIDAMRKEASNAMLKLIEEPLPNTYYMLLSKTLNILPTIKSRSIILKVSMPTYEELGVTPGVYSFFQGISSDIEKYQQEGYAIDENIKYREIGKNLKEYGESGDFQAKINIYSCLRDYVNERNYLSLKDKIFFVDEILRNIKDREMVKDILVYTTGIMGYLGGLEHRLWVKSTLAFPVNTRLVLSDFFINI